MPKPYIITSSILSADFTRLGEQITAAENAGVDWIHVDVMDGHFVPNLTMGPFVVEACRRVTNIPIDAHLMVENPGNLLRDFANAGASLLYVHVENNPHLHKTLETIRELGMETGVVINPGTPASSIQAVMHLVNAVLVMTVNPGYSGQEFIPDMISKISLVRKALDQVKPSVMIAVDGGITPKTLPKTLEAGAQIFIAATSIFRHPQGIREGVNELRACFPKEEMP
ncbi:MAG: ribulose-phosphate 3-epimerase [Chloroflexi bacterium]|nr:MAG: ribulose-phosphate 3-epimerase [Chloroflexota bacterium]